MLVLVIAAAGVGSGAQNHVIWPFATGFRSRGSLMDRKSLASTSLVDLDPLLFAANRGEPAACCFSSLAVCAVSPMDEKL